MADALFEAENLEPPGLVSIARGLGLDLARFEECLAAKATERKLKGIESILVDTGMLQGLPTTFVGSVMIVGARDDVFLRDAFERAARGDDSGGIPGSAYVAVLLALAALVVWFGRNARVVASNG
jgi:predicted DsbA family dithiol-disulfide isomerase